MGFKGHHHSKEAKKKIGLAQLGNKWNLGKHRSEETKNKISEAHRIYHDTIQIRLTREMIQELDMLVKKGIYPNRSEAIRDAVRRLRIK